MLSLIDLSRISAFGRRVSYGLRGALCAFLFAGVPAFAATTTTTLAVTSSGSAVTTVASGSVVTLTATVNSGAGAVTTGLVNFCDATAAYCTDIHIVGMAQLTSTGAATLTFVPGIGSHSYKAVFVGTTSNSASSSSASSLTVTGIYPSTITIAPLYGSPGNYSLTATVSGAGATAPTGTLSVLDTSNANQVLGTAALGTSTQGLSFANISTPGQGTQTQGLPAPGVDPGSFAVGDFNGDGNLDIVKVNNSSTPTATLTLLLGKGDGTFTTGTSPTISFPPFSVTVGDFNGDGKVDVAVSSSADNAIAVLLSNGDGTFTESGLSRLVDSPSGNGPMLIGDFNGDGKPDLAMVNEKRVVGTLYFLTVGLGNGDGTFTAAPGTSTGDASPAASGDFNGDGKLDVILSTGIVPSVSLLVGNGDGTFTVGSSLAPNYAGPVAVGDLNGDGKLDVIVGNVNTSVISVFLGNGDGTFTAAPSVNVPDGSLPASVLVADFNNDGKPDLAILPGSSNVTNVLLGNGDGTFTAAASVLTVKGSRAAGDLNGDGLPDLFGPDLSDDSATVWLAQLTQATASVNNFSAVGTGTHQVLASYFGDGIYGPSVSGTVGLTALSTTTLTLTVNPATSTFGQQIALTATLSPYTAQGLSTDGEGIYFYNGSSNLGVAALSGGVATLNLTSPPAGMDSLGAHYFGDANLNASTSNSISYTVFAIPTIAFTVANHTYGDALFPIAATSNSTGAITYSVVSGPATISGSTVTLTGAGSVVLQTSQAAAGSYATGTKTTSIMVNKATLTITANNTVRVFGAANPTFTGTVTGAVNGDAFAETFSTTATAASIVGAYSIVPSVTGTNLGNYTVGAANGVLTISQAGTATTFALSNQNLTLTATVAPLISGVPTGTVSFYEGQTLAGTGTLSNGTASYTASSFPAGNVVVSAQYSGDANFTQSASPPILALSVTPTSTSLSVAQAGSVTDTVNLSPAPGYTGTVQLSCGNLPQSATCSFQPSSIAFTGTNSSASATVTIQTGVSTQGAVLPLLPGRKENRVGVLAMAMWVPGLFAAGIARRRRKTGSRMDKLLLLTVLCGIAAGLTACGGSSTPSSGSTGRTPTGAYTVQVVASGPNGLSQTAKLNLTVQ
jgi:hypothetical protein